MKRVILLTLLLCSVIYAKSNDVVTKDDIRVLSERMDKGFEQIGKRFEQIDKRFEQIDKRFEQIDKRFEQIDKRFEQMQHYMDKRFEQIDKRFEQMQHYMDKRFEQIQHSTDKRFEQIQHNMDKRFDEQMSFLYLITTIFTTFTIGIIGFALWDRNTIVSKAKDDIEKNSKLTQLIDALKELSKKDKELEDVLKRYGVV